ncbi:MAG: hypothetical protein ACYDH5_18365 [Acidimicrobiales bacterium]
MTVPAAHTGKPWAGWLWWAMSAGMGLAGVLLISVRRRRRIA